MGSLILCHRKHAKQPYEIVRIHRKIYTIEELCYYLWNNIYLIDYTIMNQQLCNWIENELELYTLAEELRESLENYGSVEHFVLSILRSSAIYTNVELNQIQNVLEHLKNLKEIECRKYKADNLMGSGAVKSAILVYHSILREERDETVDGKFYGRVYGCLGSAYGKMFLYEEAAKMYEAGYQICEDPNMLEAYLYSCYRYMSEEEYKILLSKSEIYVKLHEQMEARIKKEEDVARIENPKKLLHVWRERYKQGYI